MRILFPAFALTVLATLMAESAHGQRAVDSAVRPVSASALPDSVVAARCGAEAPFRREGVLYGRARDEGGRPLPDVAVTVTWRTDPEDTRTTVATLGALSNDDGIWLVCAVPLRTVVVRATAEQGIDEVLAVLDDDHRADLVDLLLARPLSSLPQGSRANGAVVVVSAVDRLGAMLSNVNLEVQSARGTVYTAVTNSDGRALIPAVEPGRVIVRTRAMGYQPGEVAVTVDVGRNTVPLLLDKTIVPVLAGVHVVGDRVVLARHEDFEQRRRLHLATTTITADEIHLRNPADTWQMLTNVPSMRVASIGYGVFAQSSRGMRAVPKKNGGVEMVPCFYRLMIDGLARPDAMPDLNDLPRPSEIHGIEIFAGPAMIPPQYNSTLGGSGDSGNNICGLIAIWTK
ncbi:MAG: TonB-dependent receptor [bacterium]